MALVFGTLHHPFVFGFASLFSKFVSTASYVFSSLGSSSLYLGTNEL